MRRKTLGLTQAQLAEKAGISAGSIFLVEKGETNPTIATIEAIAKALGCTREDLTEETAESSLSGIFALSAEMLRSFSSAKPSVQRLVLRELGILDLHNAEVDQAIQSLRLKLKEANEDDES